MSKKMRIMVLAMLATCFVRSVSATEKKLPWSRDMIEFQRDLLPNELLGSSDNKYPVHMMRLLSEHNWDDCLKLYKHAMDMNWMTEADVADWKSAHVAPEFRNGVFVGIGMYCD